MEQKIVPGATYLLERTDPESVRLNKQHELLKKYAYNGRTIIDSSVDLSFGGTVLDAGTGNGVWLFELAQQVPQSVSLYGLDISDVLFPLVVPPNIQMHVCSVTKLPDEWADKFDVVHQRLLIFGLRAAEWPAVISEFFRVLKPGGYIQLVDMSPSSGWADQTESRRTQKAIVEGICAKKGYNFDCGDRLPGFMEAAGFTDVLHEKKRVPLSPKAGEGGDIGQQCDREIWRQMKRAVMGAGGYGVVRSEKDFDDLMDAIDKEDEETEVSYLIDVICARKPAIHGP